MKIKAKRAKSKASAYGRAAKAVYKKSGLKGVARTAGKIIAYKFTPARKAALAKAQRASALARKGKASAAGAIRSVTGMRPGADNRAGSGGGRRGRGGPRRRSASDPRR
jgi:hypothetical protein